MTFSIYEMNQLLAECSLTHYEYNQFVKEYQEIIDEKNERLRKLKYKIMEKRSVK